MQKWQQQVNINFLHHQETQVDEKLKYILKSKNRSSATDKWIKLQAVAILSARYKLCDWHPLPWDRLPSVAVLYYWISCMWWVGHRHWVLLHQSRSLCLYEGQHTVAETGIFTLSWQLCVPGFTCDDTWRTILPPWTEHSSDLHSDRTPNHIEPLYN